MFLYPKTLVYDDLQSRENGFTFMEEFMDGKHGISRHNAKVDKTYGLSFDAVTPNDEIAAYAHDLMRTKPKNTQTSKKTLTKQSQK